MSLITTERLLREMVDLAGLTRHPEPFYKTVQFSSYDRRSVAPDAPGWFANGDNANTTDRRHFLRDAAIEGRTEHVLTEVEGPGALVRFWSANPWVGDSGRLRIYLDDSPNPVLEAPLLEFVDGAAGIPKPFAQRAAGGAGNVYFPIGFQRRCLVTHDANWSGFYYQINVRQYESDTEVRTYSPRDLTTDAGVIASVGSCLADPTSYEADAAERRSFETTLAPEARQDVLSLQGPSAITEFALRVSAPDTTAALRQTLLQVYFDESPTPQIESPIGDFFGSGPGVCPTNSLPMQVAPDGTLRCRFVMPFARSARVRLANFGRQTVTVVGSASLASYEWDDRSMHLRTKWRVNQGVEGRPDGYDWPFLIAHGSGVWVGTALMVMNPTPIPTPGGGWWGEGDEKVYLDGEAFPSTFGTGSEDYFGYSWSSPDLFQTAFIGQTRCDGPGNRGFTANHRWHILDAMPFSRSIEFHMELQTHTPTSDMTYARIGYCYTRPGARDDHPQLNRSMLVLRNPPAWQVEAKGSAQGSTILEAERLEVASGDIRYESGALWSNGSQLRWEAREGESLTLRIPISEPGTVRVVLCFTVFPGGGSCSAEFGGVADAAREYSLDHPALTMLREFGGPTRKVEAGEAPLKLTCARTGVIGFDYIRLAPVRG